MASGIYICKKAEIDVKDGDSCKILTENELLECLDKSREHAMKGLVRDKTGIQDTDSWRSAYPECPVPGT